MVLFVVGSVYQVPLQRDIVLFKDKKAEMSLLYD